MNRAIEILKEEQIELNRSIKLYIQTLENCKKSIIKFTDTSYRESLLTNDEWSDERTVDDFITINLNSSKKALKKYTDRLNKAFSELKDIETALKILKENGCENENSGKKNG